VQTLSAASYEVIVTDDGRAITAEEMVHTRYPWTKWVKGPGKGPAANRNNGAKAGSGDFIAFIDDDCIPDKDWLRQITEWTEKVDIIEGQTVIPDHVDNPFKQGIENRGGGAYWTCNLAVRRSLFESLNGFDEEFGEACAEDMEFAWRARQLGRPQYVPEAIVNHPTRDLTWRTIYRRSFLIKWHQLYKHKTGQAVPVEDSTFRAITFILVDRFMHQVRCTVRLVTHHDPRWWRTSLFFQIWNWIMLPITIPYLMIWEVQYRNKHRARQS
jgi:GT2 family glycosyltransferase